MPNDEANAMEEIPSMIDLVSSRRGVSPEPSSIAPRIDSEPTQNNIVAVISPSVKREDD